MGKHSGTQDPNDLAGPSGPGPHPTPKQSEEAGIKFDSQFRANVRKARKK